MHIRKNNRLSKDNDQKLTLPLETCLQAYCSEMLSQRLAEEDLALTGETLRDASERYASELMPVIVRSVNNMIEDDMANIMKLLGRK